VRVEPSSAAPAATPINVPLSVGFMGGSYQAPASGNHHLGAG
jgi:hypothetical protein